MVEGTVGVISTFILAVLRNGQFFSLRELNEAIREKLNLFNSKPFQKKEGSRLSMFEEENCYLLPLPSSHYEMSTWKIATVSPDYHISVEKMNYSVPYEYIKQKVDVRLTTGTVEVFFEGNRICSHIRLYGRPDQYSTIDVHMPPEHQQYIKWNSERFIEWAAKIGKSTEIVIKAILGGYKVEQQGYKSCMGILKLVQTNTRQNALKTLVKRLSVTPRVPL